MRLALSIAFLVGFLAGGPAMAGITSLDEALSERTMGRDDAPVTILEHSSLGCPHCAAFHRDTLPKIKQTYIDTGQVRLVFNDFPLGNRALAAAMLARCVDRDKFFGLVELFFRSQKKWSDSRRPLDELLKVVRFAGMSKADFDACLGNEALMNGIRQRAGAASKKYDIQATPTFIIGETKVPGNLPFEKFRKIIDQALGTQN